MTGITIIVPAFDEEQGIGAVLDRIYSVLESSGLNYEIIVVDDGSQDGTAIVAGAHEGVSLLRHSSNRGYGAALKTGIRHARYDLIGITDADGTYPNERIPDLVARLVQGGHDMVVGARVGEKVAIPLIRRPAKWAIGKLGNLIAGERIPDVNSGLRVFRRGAVRQFFKLLPDGFSFTTTITLAMLSNGYRVDYVPINYHARVGSSKIHPIGDMFNFVHLILRIALYFAPLKIFLPLGGFLFFSGLAWGIFTRVVLGKLADVSTVVIVMAAVQVAVVGLLAELANYRLPSYYRDEE